MSFFISLLISLIQKYFFHLLGETLRSPTFVLLDKFVSINLALPYMGMYKIIEHVVVSKSAPSCNFTHNYKVEMR